MSPRMGGRGKPLGLSEREVEVVQLVAGGGSNKQIADDLLLAPETVRSHLHRITLKLGARNRAHIVAICYRSGLIA